MIKVAIAGKANVGKNLTAELLKGQLSGETLITAFAEPIKTQTLQIFPWADPNCLFGPSHLRELIIPKTDKTYRDWLTQFGTLVRSFYDLAWINLIDLQTKYWLNGGADRNVIISDLRFPPEYDWAQQDGFILIRVKRPGAPVHDDITETSLDHMNDDQFDFIIYNDGTLTDLQIKVAVISAQIRLKK